jgi:transglutaminase-like putative cysteine protease
MLKNHCLFISNLLILLAVSASAQEVFKFQYKVGIDAFPADADEVSVLIPTPTSSSHQTIKALSVETSYDYEWLKTDRFRNKYLRLRFTETSQIPNSLELTLKGKAKRFPVTKPQHYRQVRESTQPFLRPDSLIPLTKPIEEEVNKALEKSDEGTATARAFYDHLLATMTYDKSGEGWGKGDAIYACNAKTGNCTDFHSLFIGMCRSKGIPARFHIGFPLSADQKSGSVKGYHCWAEFFDAEKGWVPVDISEAWKNKNKADFYYGGLDPYRLTITSGRDIKVSTAPGQIKQLNYFVYPKVYVDGQQVDQGVSTTFQYQFLE